MVMILCRKRGYVYPSWCGFCKIPEAKRIAKGKITYDRGPYKGDEVSPGSCPHFVEVVDTAQTIESPCIPRVVDKPFRRYY